MTDSLQIIEYLCVFLMYLNIIKIIVLTDNRDNNSLYYSNNNNDLIWKRILNYRGYYLSTTFITFDINVLFNFYCSFIILKKLKKFHFNLLQFMLISIFLLLS
jgi:NADH:ubiquinone oxidoreductase subunit 3 (subunit A)